MTDPTVTRVAWSVLRHRARHMAVTDDELARTPNGDQVTAEEVQAELARITDQLGAAQPVVAPYRPTGALTANDVHLPAEVASC